MDSVRAVSPGRVNLIGEHTDYNGGMVMPAALSVHLEAELTPREDDIVRISAEPFGMLHERTLEDPAKDHWSDPAVGALREARALGLIGHGADLLIASTIPAGAGLSSSAALIVTVLKAARMLAKSDMSDTEIAVAARRVETDYIGVPVGIMDQMAVAIAQPGEAIALDTATLDYELVTLPKGYSIEVIHSGVTRQLSDGRYKERKEECDAARIAFGRDDICTLNPAKIAENTEVSDVIRRRALHCATEHRRVKAAVDALAGGDIATLGALMIASHTSMRDDFEMSVPLIDALVDDAVALGAVGARLTGGGFGGCIVACVAEDQRDGWLEGLLVKHPEARFIDRIARAT
ncbi:galactokinase [Qipengyuania sp. DGS5-3]|uniref:galactokinase n=1 Tax=Qipengyuania sp. DGS5-3 TaxID=3349632 RepID=UPI0036D42C51